MQVRRAGRHPTACTQAGVRLSVAAVTRFKLEVGASSVCARRLVLIHNSGGPRATLLSGLHRSHSLRHMSTVPLSRLSETLAALSSFASAAPPPSSSPDALLSRAALLAADFKAANRAASLAVEAARARVSAAGASADARARALANAQYARAHLARELRACLEFPTAELDRCALLSPSELPDDVRASVGDDAHALVLARLAAERGARAALESSLDVGRRRLAALRSKIKAKAALLEGLSAALERVETASAPLEAFGVRGGGGAGGSSRGGGAAGVATLDSAQRASLPLPLSLLCLRLSAARDALPVCDGATLEVAAAAPVSAALVSASADARFRAPALRASAETAISLPTLKRRRGEGGGGAESLLRVGLGELLTPAARALVFGLADRRLRFEYLPVLDLVTLTVEGAPPGALDDLLGDGDDGVTRVAPWISASVDEQVSKFPGGRAFDWVQALAGVGDHAAPSIAHVLKAAVERLLGSSAAT
jgi:hypothetical protein